VADWLFEGKILVFMDTQEPVTVTLEIVSQSVLETQRAGKILGELLQGGELILLDGQLGTGKTTFTQGLAKGMNIEAVVNSPTFTILKEYTQRRREQSSYGEKRRVLLLYHFDLYPLEDAEEINDLGFDEYFASNGVCVVEWADKVGDIWPAECLGICLRMLDEAKRALLFIATGSQYCELLRQFQKKMYAAVST
jgi:tRNA threonylcarbamoyladenosine biosynthesis protein TsaE